MKRIAALISWLALAAAIAPALLFFFDKMTLDAVKLWMLVATVVWFVTAPLWMEHKVG
jgi:hypothetical protein